MSTIDSLTIQGIRSFGTKAEDRQNISFASPVTLILGANGSGKTTIIECLKYALTGEVPPGSNRGQSFIHDPKIFDFSESLGQVKLAVRNIRGEKLTVARSMKISHKRGKMSFETLDATINYEAEGKKESISKRCVDTDVEMCQFMGVSKAIINNVIFCHQEDSSWPLDEGKKLKEKFDAIFGTTEYNKAIEKIIKLRKAQADELKIKETDLKHLSHMKKEMENKTLDLQNAKKKLEGIESQCIAHEEELKPIEDRITQIYKIEMDVGRLQARKITLSTQIQNCNDQIAGLESKIKNIFDGNIPQLDREIRTFHEKMEDKKCELQNLDEKLQSIKSQEKKIQSTLTELERKASSLVHQRQQEQEYLSERANKIRSLCGELNVPVGSIELEETGGNVVRILDKIKNALSAEGQKIKDESAAHDKIDQEKQNEVDELRVSKTKIESDTASMKSQKTQLDRDRLKIEQEIKNVEASAKTLTQLNNEIDRMTETYNRLMESYDMEQNKKQIDEKRQNVAKLQEQFTRLDERLTMLNSLSKIMAEINLKQTELQKKELEVKRVKNKHSDNFRRVFPNRTIESNFKRNVQIAYEELQRSIKDLNAKVNSEKLKEKELEIKRKNQKDELTRWEKERDEGKDKIYDKCHSTPYEELLAKSKETIQKYQLDHGVLKSSEAMNKKYMQRIREDPCCPLCSKSMSSSEAAQLTEELSDEIHRLPENIKKTEELLKREQIKYEALLSLRPTIEKVQKLEVDIPKRRADLQQTEEKLAGVANEVESLQMLTAEPTANLEVVNSMLGDMSLLDEAMKDVDRLHLEVEKLKKKLPAGSSTDSIEDVQLEKTAVAADLKNERSSLEEKERNYERASESMNKLREKKNAMKDKQLKLQEGVQSLPKMKERYAEISEKIGKMSTDILDLESQLEPFKRKLNTAIEEKEHLKQQNRKKLNKMVEKLDKLKKIDSEIQRYTKELNDLAELNLVEAIDKLKVTMKRQRDEQLVKSTENAEAADAIEKLKIEIFNHEANERDLKDNRELKLLQQKLSELRDQQEDLIKEIGKSDFQNMTKEKETLAKRRDALNVKKAELIGQQGEIKIQIRKIENEINETVYKDSVKNYRKGLYEVEVMKKLIADLGQYRITLEWALMKFHSEKMEKINRLIREFWRQIYRGNDIDYIQIQTDEMKTEKTDAKRSYNYRVVQSKNNVEIDMRGRCSAGQRVLASLIIRMALAETFSSNCGVLALDEPTTNLDRVNILSLCEALNRIVEERQSQSNFMLIIITHDEEFIQTLGKINSYHKVFRNDDGKSVIRKVKVA